MAEFKPEPGCPDPESRAFSFDILTADLVWEIV